MSEVLREYVPGAEFKHYDQSLRIVDVLEKHGQGLNLTWEVRDGILGHSKGSKDLGIVEGTNLPTRWKACAFASPTASPTSTMTLTTASAPAF